MNIIKLELKNNIKNLIIWIVSLSIIITALLLFFPSMKTESMKVLVDAKLEGINPLLLESLGLTEMVDFTIITNYFGYVLQFIVIAIYIYITQNSYNLLIKEEKDGTIEYIYSKPIKRSTLFWNKVVFVILSYTVLILSISLVSFILYLILSDYPVLQSFKEIIKMFLGIYLVGYIYIAIGLFASMFSNKKTDIPSVGAGIVMMTFIIGVISSINKNFKYLKYLAPIKWVEYQNLLNNSIKLSNIMLIIIITSVLVYCSLLKYQKRDLII